MEWLRKPLRFAYRVLGRHYLKVMLALQFQFTFVVVLAGIGLLTIYTPISVHRFVVILLVAEGFVLIENALALWVVFRLLRPAEAWENGERNARTAAAAWGALAGLPLDFIRYRRALPVLFNIVPIAIFIWAYLGLAWWALPVLLAGASVVLLWGAMVRYFAIELIVRPVLEKISPYLEDGVAPDRPAVSLKVKLLLALPAINVVSGVIVAAIANRAHARLGDLGLDVLAAIAVALSISLELTVLLSRSILEPIGDLRRATDKVGAGDYSTRVPVITADETGKLAGSFNRMVAGLQERELLREAFGTFVDPELTERVLSEGAMLAGEEVEVSVLFLDIRDFTSFAERSSASEVVAQLNEFYEVVVPIIVKHGGHANKFIGDGLLGVFGAPVRHANHADRVVSAALEIAATVRERYGERLRIGIGVNSGPVVAGTIGGGGHLEFTVIGDPVNTASRVEHATRETGDDVLITEATRCLLTRDHGGFIERPTIELRGKSELVTLHAPLVAASDTVGAWQPKPSRSPSSTAAD
jgi:class 3 adenylate cyclase